MATARESRYERLMLWGFVRKEATEFSRVDFDSPKVGLYWWEMFRKRDAQYKAYLAKGHTREEWVLRVKHFYAMKGWYLTVTVKGKKVRRLNPWKLIKALKKNYEERNPQWRSPWMKRQKLFHRTQRRIDRELQYAEPPK